NSFGGACVSTACLACAARAIPNESKNAKPILYRGLLRKLEAGKFICSVLVIALRAPYRKPVRPVSRQAHPRRQNSLAGRRRSSQAKCHKAHRGRLIGLRLAPGDVAGRRRV